MYQKLKLKRILDIALSIVGIVLASPVLIILVIAIKCSSKGPILFSQNRIGKNKKTFKILKFRTMMVETPNDTPTHLLNNPNQYITKVGKFLRKSSMDELPQLWNIFKGDMSIVGPRPALWNQHDLIAERDKYGANNIYPGLTGWAQVNGRDELPINVKARFDGDYAKEITFNKDFKCIFLTLLGVIKREGIVEGSDVGRTKLEIAITEEKQSEKNFNNGCK